ncbi:MAG: DUF2635 domain-containing protein [Sphingomonas sp.]
MTDQTAGRRFIKPRGGLTVPDPYQAQKPLPPHGKGVAWDSHWQRRLNDGDVVETTEEEVLAGDKALDDEARAAGKPRKGDAK